MRWKRLLIPLASVPVILLLAYGFRTDPKAIPSPLVKKPAPEFRLTVFGGGEISLAGLKGKPAVLNFWAIRRVSEAGLKTKSQRKRFVLISLLIAKMGAMMGVVFLIIRYLPINVLAFVVGLSTFFVSIMIVSFRGHADAAET